MRESARQRRAVISSNYLKNTTLLEAQELPDPHSFLDVVILEALKSTHISMSRKTYPMVIKYQRFIFGSNER